MKLKSCGLPFMMGLLVAILPSARGQLAEVHESGVIDSLGGNALDLLDGVYVGANWEAVFAVPADLSLVSVDVNSTTYRGSADGGTYVQVGGFTTAATMFTMRFHVKESYTTSDGQDVRTDVLQLWGNTFSPDVVFSAQLYYPIGTLKLFDPVIPTFAPSAVRFFINAQDGGYSAGATSFSERGSFEPRIRPVPEPSAFGMVAGLVLVGAILARRKSAGKASAA